MSLTRLMQAFDDAVMPQRCAFCGTRTHRRERSVCSACYEELPWAESAPTVPPLQRVVAPLAYEFPVDAAIKALKFRRRLWYGPAMAGLLHAAVAGLPDEPDAVLPVPLHWRRQWQRGFNQAQEIAVPIARQLGVPLIGGVRRLRATRPQSGLSAAERQQNLRAAFVASRSCSARHVLIVDDVITTGATIGQLAHAVLRGGAERVSAVAVAQA